MASLLVYYNLKEFMKWLHGVIPVNLREPWQHEQIFPTELNCDGGTLLPSWSAAFSHAFLLQYLFPVLQYHLLSTSLGPQVAYAICDPLSSYMGCPSRKVEVLLCYSCRRWSLR